MRRTKIDRPPMTTRLPTTGMTMNKSKIPKIEILVTMLREWLENTANLVYIERLVGRNLPGRGDFIVQTICGELRVHVYEDWYATAFVDTDKAKAHFGVTGIGQGRLNPHSGKWNWHPWDVCPSGFRPKGGKYSKAVLFDLADEFIIELSKIITDTEPK
jgi:hypothetical protein